MVRIPDIIGRYIESLKDERILFFLTIGFAMIFYFLTLSLNSTYDDNLSYIQIGKDYAETGKYTGNFWTRPPVIPFLISLFYVSGIDLITITILIPLLFVLLFLLANYFLFRELFGKEMAFLVVWMIISFAPFWRWGERVLVDIPLGSFVTLSLLFFYIGMEKDSRFFVLASVFFCLAIFTKLSGGLLIPIFLIYFIYRRKWGLIKETYFTIFVLIGLVIPIAVVGLLYFHDHSLFSTDTLLYVNSSSQGKDYLVKFMLTPLFVFLPFGLLRFFKNRGNEGFLLFITIVCFVGFFWLSATMIRYLAPIFGSLFFFSLYGLSFLKRSELGKKFFAILYIVGVLVGLMNTLFILDFVDSKTRYGVFDTTEFLKEAAGQDVIAAGTFAGYIDTHSSLNVIPFPFYVEVRNETLTIEEFNKIITTPEHELYQEYSDLSRREIPTDFFNFDKEWIDQENVTCVVWTVYDDFTLEPVNSQYNILYGGIEVPLKGSYHSIRPPPEYIFRSDVYLFLESELERVKSFSSEGRETVLIYKTYS